MTKAPKMYQALCNPMVVLASLTLDLIREGGVEWSTLYVYVGHVGCMLVTSGVCWSRRVYVEYFFIHT